MRLSGFRWVRSMNSPLGLCLCLVLIGLTTAGAIAYTNQSYSGETLPGVRVCQAEPLQQNEIDYAPAAIDGNKPVIQVWKATPMVLDSPTSAAVYTFKVKRATNVQIGEAGANIKNISNPTGATVQGTANGNPASAIPWDENGQATCTITASNENGSVQKELKLSLAKELLPPPPPAGQSDNQAGNNKSKWLDSPLRSTPPVSTQPPITINEPNFFKCPSGCENCLTPGDAASLGFTQKCSDVPCYYDPAKTQWFCYKPTPGWCCANNMVTPSTKAECDKMYGYWSTSQNDAKQACEKGCCCLSNGQISYPSTQTQCAQVNGTYYTNLGQCKELCKPKGCCCVNGQTYYPSTQSQCAQMNGQYYTDLSTCKARCEQPTGCCCVNGQMQYPTTQIQCTQMYGQYYTDLGMCKELCHPQLCWCCTPSRLARGAAGSVSQMTQAQCQGQGGACYATQAQATAACSGSKGDTPYQPPTNLR
jgi:hypothetical protein